MNKFPILNLYRILFYIGSVLVLFTGVFVTFSDMMSPESTLALPVIISGLVPFIVASTLFIFIAEIIKLGLAIEKHLETIAQR